MALINSARQSLRRFVSASEQSYNFSMSSGGGGGGGGGSNSNADGGGPVQQNIVEKLTKEFSPVHLQVYNTVLHQYSVSFFGHSHSTVQLIDYNTTH